MAMIGDAFNILSRSIGADRLVVETLMQDTPQATTPELMKSLPAQAQLAIAVRCVRRILPLLTDMSEVRDRDRKAAVSIVDEVERALAAGGQFFIVPQIASSAQELQDVQSRPGYWNSMCEAGIAVQRLAAASGNGIAPGINVASVAGVLEAADAAASAAAAVTSRVAVRQARVGAPHSMHAPVSAGMGAAMIPQMLQSQTRSDVENFRSLLINGNWANEAPIAPDLLGPLWPGTQSPPWPPLEQYRAAEELWGIEGPSGPLRANIGATLAEVESSKKRLTEQEALVASSVRDLQEELARVRESVAIGIKNQVDEGRVAYATAAATAKSESEAAAEDVKAKLKSTTDDIAETYRKHMALKSPVEYWEKKREQHQGSVVFWGTIFLIGLFGGGYAFYWFAMAYLPAEGKWETLPVARLVATAILVMLGIWLLKLLARLVLSNLHLSNDAAERAVMVKCYLALRTEGALGDSAGADHVVKALFRSAGTGIMKDDANPRLPIAEAMRGI